MLSRGKNKTRRSKIACIPKIIKSHIKIYLVVSTPKHCKILCLLYTNVRRKVVLLVSLCENWIVIDYNHIAAVVSNLSIPMRSFAQEKKSQQAPEIDALVRDRKVFAWCHKIN